MDSDVSQPTWNFPKSIILGLFLIFTHISKHLLHSSTFINSFNTFFVTYAMPNSVPGAGDTGMKWLDLDYDLRELEIQSRDSKLNYAIID